MLLGFRCSLLFLFRRTVNDIIGDEANGQRRQQIQHRMLPEKNCGDRDQEGGYAKYDLPWQCGKMAAVPCGKHDRHGADHMERGADIGIGVEAVEKLHHVHHPVVPGEFYRAEFLAVWEKNIDRHRGPIGDGQIADELSEGGDVI